MKLFPRRAIIFLSVVFGLSTLPLSGKTIIFSYPDTTVNAGQAAFNDTLQLHYAELIRIIGASTDSVISHIHEIDTGYSGKLAAIHDSLSSALPANTNCVFRDSLSSIYSGFLQVMIQNRQTWTEAVMHFRKSVFLNLNREKNRSISGKYTSDEDYSFGIRLFDNFADSIYQFVKDTIAGYSDNAGSSMNNLFATLRDSLQGFTVGFLQLAGEESNHPDSKPPAESAAGMQSDSPRPHVSLYASFSRRYDRNPLCNYQKIGDQMWQSYHELKYLTPFSSDLLSVKYIGGLNLFNTLEERNYYESMLTGKYRVIFGQHEPVISDDASDDSFEKFSSLNISVNAGARFDKHFYNDYNNHGLALVLTFKRPITDSLFVFLKNTVSSRKYETSSDLSNTMELLFAGVSGKLPENFTYDVSLQGGIKQYTETLIDTVITGYIDNNESQPILSYVAQPIRTYHSAVNFRLLKTWETSSLQLTFGYTTNFNSKARFLRKNIDKPRLTEDIYYDFFSYTGEDARIEFQEQIPFNIRMNAGADVHFNRLYLPAFTLSGTKTAENRHDILSGLSVVFSRYFDSGLGFGYEANISGGLVRRMSKDEYNDFSSFYTSAGISIGW
jgi:hypothetical protein